MMTWTFLRFYENLQRQLIKQMCLAYLCFMLFSLKSSQTWSRNTSAGAVEAKSLLTQPEIHSNLGSAATSKLEMSWGKWRYYGIPTCPAKWRLSSQFAKFASAHEGAKPSRPKWGTIHIQGDQGLCTSLVQGIGSALRNMLLACFIIALIAPFSA